MREWSVEYNPFNSKKLIYHAKYWESISNGIVPPPILVTLDPVNRCNFNCPYCNAAARLRSSSSEFSDYIVDNIASFLARWGTKAVCLAGGGEPLLHSRAGDIVENLVTDNIEVGVVTNGSMLECHKTALAKCRWVGVSVDAGTRETFAALKKMPASVFDRVLDNIATLHAFEPTLEITYKFLAHPINISSIYEAVRLAKTLGCRFFHMRPVGNSWDNLSQPNIFTSLDIALAETHVKMARQDFEDDNFHVFGVVHKFSGDWGVRHDFKQCHAVAMTTIVQPDNTIGLCCDRRGDPKLELGSFDKLEDILELWGSTRHLDIMRTIDLRECPRCTYGPHNQLFEHMVLSDSTCKNFI
jgi:sulfatase maturation enzyme AslB (radical SAM superfamily)